MVSCSSERGLRDVVNEVFMGWVLYCRGKFVAEVSLRIFMCERENVKNKLV